MTNVRPTSIVLLCSIACGPSLAQENAEPANAASVDTTVTSAEVTREPASEDATEAPVEPAVPAMSADGPTIVLACGRATARLPAAFAPSGDVSCSNPGYPMPIVAENVGGTSSDDSVSGHGCSFGIESSEHLTTRNAIGVEPISGGATLTLHTPEETVLVTRVRQLPHDATCARIGEALAAVLRDSMSVRPLRELTVRAQAQITSAGHGITIELPEGYWLFSLGGEADQYETAYRVFGPGETSATFVTRWDAEADASVRGRFNPVVLRRSDRPRTSDEAYDPITTDPCRRAGSMGPELSIVTNVEFCGPPSGDAALLRIVRAARFTPPPPEESDEAAEETEQVVAPPAPTPRANNCSCCGLVGGANRGPEGNRQRNEAYRQCIANGGACGGGCPRPPSARR